MPTTSGSLKSGLAAQSRHHRRPLAESGQEELGQGLHRLGVDLSSGHCRFEEHNSVDRERFTSFDNDLRQALFEEPIRFFVDLLQNDGSVLDFLHGKHTFVNPRGEERTIAWSTAPLHDEHGNVRNVICGGLDVTERERQLHRARGAVLQLAVAQHTVVGARATPQRREGPVSRGVHGEAVQAHHDECRILAVDVRSCVA